MDRQWNNPAGDSNENEAELSARLDSLFHAYKEACPDPEPSVNFMPEMWAKIELREASSTIFSRTAKALVTAALGASVVMGLLSASYTPPPAPPGDSSLMQVLANDHVLDLEPFQVERISDLEQQ